MALLNQMKLPSAIGVELKLDSIELNPVHAFSVAAADWIPTDEASLPTEDWDEGVATETVLSIFRTLGNLRPTPCTRRAIQTNPSTT
jgi:hypothetical protein